MPYNGNGYGVQRDMPGAPEDETCEERYNNGAKCTNDGVQWSNGGQWLCPTCYEEDHAVGAEWGFE